MKDNISTRFREFISHPFFYPLFFALTIFCIFLPHIVGGYTCAALTMEGVSQWHPFWAFVRREVGEGYFPLWTPHSLGGWNLPAFSHSGVFYPWAFLFYIFSYSSAFTLTVLIHLLITYFLMYRFLRGVKVEPFCASLGSAIWATGGLLFAYADFLPLLWTITWTPLFFDSAKRWVESGRALDWLWFVVVGSLQFLGGNVEGFAYEVTALLILLVLLGRLDKIFLYRSLSLFLGVCIVAFLASVSFLPAVELLPRSVRSLGLSYSYFSERGFSFKYWVSFLLPINVLGNSLPGEKIIVPSYMGLLPLILFIYAIFGTKGRLKLVVIKLTILIVLFYLLATRDLPIIGLITYHLPLFNKMREPAYGLFVPQFFLVLVAVWGMREFFGSVGRKMSEINKREKWNIFFLSFLFFLGCILARVRVEAPFTWLKCEQYLLAIVAICVALLLIFSSKLGIKKDGVFKLALIAFFLSDNFAIAFTYLPRHKPDFLNVDEDYKGFFGKRPSYERHIIIDNRYGARTASLPPNAGMLVNSQTLEGWEGIPDLRIIKFLSLLDERVISFKDQKLDKIRHHFIFRDGKFLEPTHLPYLDLAGVKFLVSRGVPLKFASPVSLLDMKEGFQVSNKETVTFLHKQIDHILYKAIQIGSSVVFSTPLHVYEGDSLNFQLCIENAREGTFDIKIVAGADETPLFFTSLNDISSCPAKLLNLDLSDWKGKSVELRFEVRVAEGSEGGKIYLLEPEIVNNTKRFQRLFHGSIDIYENPLAFPRAFLCHNFVFLSSMEDSFKWLQENADKLAITAPIEVRLNEMSERLPTSSLLYSTAHEDVFISEYKSNIVKVTANAKDQAFLILTDLYYPGWRAWVDGVEEKIFPAYLAFRALPLRTATNTQIIFKYEPISFKIGLWTVLASFLGFAVAVVSSRLQPL